MINPIIHSPGVYFDPQNPIYFYNDYWKIVTHVDIVSIQPRLKLLSFYIENTFDVCNRAQPLKPKIVDCRDILNPTKVLLKSNTIKLQSLSHIISVNPPNRIIKRSLEFGGEILKFFFGTLDADDARKYDSAISTCQQDETQIFNLMKDNIHVVQSSINSFNSSIYKLNDNEEKLNYQINLMNNILSNYSKNNNALENIVRINGYISIIESSLLTLSNILDSILNSILFSKLNILHPSVISPTNLLTELEKYSNSINKKLDFPITLNLNNIHTIIDVSQLTSYYYNNKIIFIIQIPLISPVKYNVYRCIPLPTPHDENQPSTFALIHPTKSYLAVTDDRLSYSSFDNMRDCHSINNLYSICPYISTYSTIYNPICETKLLTDVNLKLPAECNYKLIYGHIDIWQNVNNNKWIYVQSEPTKLTVKCDDEIKDTQLSGTGVITLPANCVGFCKTIQLTPSSTKTISVASQLEINFDITLDDCCKRDIFNDSVHLLSPITLTNIDLESLTHASHKLDSLEKEINKIQDQPHIIKYGSYYSTFTYILITTMSLFCTYKLYRFCQNRRRKINQRHTPDSCCIKIFNQCYTQTIDSKSNQSLELNEISHDQLSIRSLPDFESYQKGGLKNVRNSTSNRNIFNN